MKYQNHVANTAAFKSLPPGAKLLYFSLLFASECGEVAEPRTIMTECGATTENMKALLDNHFVVILTAGVGIVENPMIANYITSIKSPPYKAGEEKVTYFGVVQLTADELAKLRQDFGDAIVKSQMQRLANFIKNNGNAGANHFKTLERWCKAEKDKPPEGSEPK